jgi:hypothetical protein
MKATTPLGTMWSLAVLVACMGYSGLHLYGWLLVRFDNLLAH